jgi:hypothetical protein
MVSEHRVCGFSAQARDHTEEQPIRDSLLKVKMVTNYFIIPYGVSSSALANTRRARQPAKLKPPPSPPDHPVLPPPFTFTLPLWTSRLVPLSSPRPPAFSQHRCLDPYTSLLCILLFTYPYDTVTFSPTWHSLALSYTWP